MTSPDAYRERGRARTRALFAHRPLCAGSEGEKTTMRRISTIAGCGAAALALLVAVAPGAQAQTSKETQETAAASAAACSWPCILGARIGAHPDFDRVVLDVSEEGLSIIDHRVSTDNSYGTPSGKDGYLQTPGKNFLFLDLTQAHSYDDSGQLRYTSPLLQQVSLPSLKGVEVTLLEFEGHVQFGLSLGDYSRYQVFTLKSPNRIVVDIYH
ncbi:AMIN-like domain-containing (lipo)protein [Streptomyces sp. NPDC055749]